MATSSPIRKKSKHSKKHHELTNEQSVEYSVDGVSDWRENRDVRKKKKHKFTVVEVPEHHSTHKKKNKKIREESGDAEQLPDEITASWASENGGEQQQSYQKKRKRKTSEDTEAQREYKKEFDERTDSQEEELRTYERKKKKKRKRETIEDFDACGSSRKKKKKRNHERNSVDDEAPENVEPPQQSHKKKKKKRNHERNSVIDMYGENIEREEALEDAEEPQQSHKKKKKKRNHERNSVIDIYGENHDRENSPEDVEEPQQSHKKKKKRKVINNLEENNNDQVQECHYEPENVDEEHDFNRQKQKKKHKSSYRETIETTEQLNHVLNNSEKVIILDKYEENIEDSQLSSDDDALKEDDFDIANSIFALHTKTNTRGKRKKLFNEEVLSEQDDEDVERLKAIDIVIDWALPEIHNFNVLQPNAMELKEAGIEPRRGPWIREEELVLMKNWEAFKQDYDIKNPTPLLGLTTHKRKNIFRRKQIVNFAKYLGKGLNNRTLLAVYHQARRMLDPHNYKGGLTASEEGTLRRLFRLYGRKWEKIGRVMGRTGECVLTSWLKIENFDKNCGSWSESEDSSLIAALKEVTGFRKLKKLTHHDLPWTKIANKVGTRNRAQCRERWYSEFVLSRRYNPHKDGVEDWTSEQTITLLNKLNDDGYLNESEVPWEDLAAEFGMPNCVSIRKKYTHLRLVVPEYYIKTYREILDWLITNYVPRLLKKRNADAESESSDEKTEDQLEIEEKQSKKTKQKEQKSTN